MLSPVCARAGSWSRSPPTRPRHQRFLRVFAISACRVAADHEIVRIIDDVGIQLILVPWLRQASRKRRK